MRLKRCDEYPIASNRARLVIRIERGSGRMSSPSPASIVEGLEMDLLVVPARIQRCEIRDAVDPDDRGFTIDKRTAWREAFTVPLDDHAEAVVLDLVKPVLVGRDLRRARRDAALEF